MSNEEKLLKEYYMQIQNFENVYVKHNFNNYKKYPDHEGYLINLEYYEDLKSKIYRYFKENISAKITLESLNYLNSIKIKTATYLINMLINKNKYIIINNNLWELFGNKKDINAKIFYTIIRGNLIIQLEDQIELIFSCWKYDNVIDFDSFSREKNSKYYEKLTNNYGKIKTIYKEIQDYYKFEKEIINQLNHNIMNEHSREICYLVDEKWFKNWEEMRCYGEIRKILEIDNKEKLAKDKIIFMEEINKTKQRNISKIKIQKFENENDLNRYLKNNSLVLVNGNFLYNFVENSDKGYLYYAAKNIIHIFIKGKEFKIKANNNIITLKTNNTNISSDSSDVLMNHFKHLIKFFYYQKQLKLDIYSKNIHQNIANNEIYFINEKAIKKYKEFFLYSSLSIILELN